MYRRDEHNENHFFDKNNHNKKLYILNDKEAPYKNDPDALYETAIMSIKAPQRLEELAAPP